jgi:predicted O-methyltransferase YrrM
MNFAVGKPVRRFANTLVDRLPSPRDHAARQVLRSTRDLVTGRAAPVAKPKNKPKKKTRPAPKAAPRGAKVFAVPGTYNSPIVDVGEIRGAGSDSGTLVEIPGIDLDPARHDAVWSEWRPLVEQWKEQAPDADRRYHADNIMFGPHSAALLAAAIGSIRPRRYIEIGSGFSSAVVLDVNDEQRRDDPIQCTFIEPFPDRLNSILRPADRDRCTILVEKVQDVDLKVFDQLESGDVLFIDSSHIAKSGSDLLHEIFEVLPRLASGVFVHFHDIMYPFDYPLWWMVKQNRSWNEPYFLRAFLMYNPEYTVHFWSDFHALFGSHVDDPHAQRASSIWLRRT